MHTILATIAERGNGFPGPHDYVPGDDGELYRVVRAGARIETQGAGAGNRCAGYLLALADWDDVASEDDVHESLAHVAESA